MSHIHNYEEVLESLRHAFRNWRESERRGATLTDETLARLALDFILERLGISQEGAGNEH